MARYSKMSVFQILGAWIFTLYTGSGRLHPTCGKLSWWLEQGTHEAKVRCQTSFGLISLYCSLAMVCSPRLTQPSLTGNQGSVPERVHTNPLRLLKRSLKGQDLWTGVTGIIFNHEGQSHLQLKFSCQKSILLIVSRVSLEHSCFVLAQFL